MNKVMMKFDLFVLLALTTVMVSGIPTPDSRDGASPVNTDSPTSRDADHDPSFNEVEKKAKFDHDDTEVDNRIPVIYPELSETESKAVSDGSVAGSGEVKSTVDFSQPAITSKAKTVPKYMFDLYNKFSKDKYSHPMANIVRSFTNINTEKSLSEAASGSRGNATRQHRLVFNVSSVGRNEDIYLAELRLLTLVDTDRSLYDGVNRRVTISELQPATGNLSTGGGNVQQIASKLIYGRRSGWETFTVTDAVKRWVRLRATTQIVEVCIESIEHLHDVRDDVMLSDDDSDDWDDDDFEETDSDETETRSHGDVEPLLLVFSNDPRHRRLDSRELHEIIGHEMDLYETGDLPQAAVADIPADLDYEDYDDYVDYYEADDGGQSGEQVISRVERDTAAVQAAGTAADTSVSVSVTKRDLTSHVSSSSAGRRGRVRRAKYRRRIRRNICRRKPMYVNFEDIHWDGWIIQPKGYQAYECTGRCYFPLSDHLTPTKHAIVQTILHANYPRQAGRACCVPTRLDPISILYVDDQGIVTYKYKYDGMVVAECGCR